MIDLFFNCNPIVGVIEFVPPIETLAPTNTFILVSIFVTTVESCMKTLSVWYIYFGNFGMYAIC